MTQEEKYAKALKDFYEAKKSIDDLTPQQRERFVKDIGGAKLIDEISRYINFIEGMNGYYNRF